MKARARTVVETLILSSDTEDRPHEPRETRVPGRIRRTGDANRAAIIGRSVAFRHREVTKCWVRSFIRGGRAGGKVGGDACALTLRPADWQNIELSPPPPPPKPNTEHNKHRTAERRSDCGRCCGIPDHFRTTVSLSHQYYVAYRESGVIVKKPCRVVNVSGLLSPKKIGL